MTDPVVTITDLLPEVLARVVTNAHKTLTILQMHANVIRCTRPATGTLVEFPPDHPAIPIVGLEFNLGNRNTVAFYERYPRVKYFSRNTFMISGGKSAAFQVMALPYGGAFEWDIAMTVLVDGRPRTLYVDDHGAPFLTTDNPFRHTSYKVIYQP